jgi:hypothetical protein
MAQVITEKKAAAIALSYGAAAHAVDGHRVWLVMRQKRRADFIAVVTIGENGEEQYDARNFDPRQCPLRAEDVPPRWSPPGSAFTDIPATKKEGGGR